MCYPFFFYQPWPFVISMLGLAMGIAGAFCAHLVARNMQKLAKAHAEERAQWMRMLVESHRLSEARADQETKD